ncbi:MAG TPA: hypothetical protein VIC51_07725, partial [Psychromonas sp.]
PEYYSGLLGQEATDKLRKRATGTGIANALLALVAQPRNQGYGSALPYIGKALMAGQQAGQNVIQGGLRDFDAQQRIAEMKRQQEQREAQRKFASNLPENIRDAAAAYPEIASKYAENIAIPQPKAKLLTPEEQVSFGLPATGRFQQKADGTFEQVSGTAPQSPASVQEYNFARQQGYGGSYDDFLQRNKRPVNVVNVDAKGEGKYQEVLGGKLGERDFGVIDAGQTAMDKYNSSQQVKNLLAQNPITGVGAEQITKLNNLLSSAGLIDSTKGVTTEVLAANLANTTLQSIKTSGLGAGQGFTDKDREFLERAKAGQITMTAGALKQLAELNEKAAIASMKNYNTLINRLPEQNKSYYGLTPVKIPTGTSKIEGRLR